MMEPEVLNRGASFLEHFGVKGMKWGVQRAKQARPGALNPNSPARRAIDLVRPTTAGKDRQFERRAGSLGTFIKVHNRAADLANKHDVDRINNKPEYKNADFNRPSALRTKYYNEHAKAYEKRLVQAANEQKNASGTRQYDVHIQDNGNWSVHSKEIKHEDFTLEVKVITDKKGKITKLEPVENSMEQAVARGVAFLEHYGVKGMKWGVRRNRSQTPVTTESRVNAGIRGKTKVKAKGGVAHPASSDAVKAASLKQKHKKSGAAALSNNELRELATRLQLEQQVKVLNAQSKSSGKKFVKDTLKDTGQQQSRRVFNAQVAKKVAKTGALAAA